MPYIEIKTNTQIKPAAVQAFNVVFPEIIGQIPGKTEAKLMFNIEGGHNMYFAGSDSPCAIATVSLYGSSTREAYDEFTASLTMFIQNLLSIPASRIYVKYEEVSTWGRGGKNF